MKIYFKNIGLMFLCTIYLFSCTKDKYSKSSIEEHFDIKSNFTETDYTITVFYPEKAFPTTNVPIVYLLDGFWWEDMAKEEIYNLKLSNKIKNCILVSLDYKEGNGPFARRSDLIYPGEQNDTTSVGDLFYKFLTEELAPKVESEYNIDTTNRVLFGHSFGGIFVIYSMLDNANNPFYAHHIAASASLGYGADNYVLQKELEIISSTSVLNTSLFLGCGKYVGSSTILHEELYERILSRNYNGFTAKLGIYDEQHGTDPYPSFSEGMQFSIPK